MTDRQNDTKSMALFCDFENVALGVRESKFHQFDINKVLERLLLKGSIVVKKAYCDWERYREFKAAMHQASFELIEIPHVRMSGKNSADIRMVVDALDLCYMKSHVDTFVIISGDSDFSPLVSKLRENAKTVIGVGVKNSTSELLISNCDEFIYYDDLVRPVARSTRRRTGDRHPERSSERGTDRMSDRGYERGADRTAERGADRSVDRSTDRLPDRSADRTSDRSFDRTVDRPIDRAGERVVDRPSERLIERSNERLHEPPMDPPVERAAERPLEAVLERADESLADRPSDALEEVSAVAQPAQRATGRARRPAAAKRGSRGRAVDAPALPESSVLGGVADGLSSESSEDHERISAPVHGEPQTPELPLPRGDAPESPGAGALAEPSVEPSGDAVADAAPVRRRRGTRKSAAVEVAPVAVLTAEPAPAPSLAAGQTRGFDPLVVSVESAGERTRDDMRELVRDSVRDSVRESHREEVREEPRDQASFDRRQQGLDLVVGMIEALAAERGEDEKIWGSMVKQTLKRRKPGFNETYYGFRSFNRLLEEARDRGLIELDLDDKSGGYTVRSLA